VSNPVALLLQIHFDILSVSEVHCTRVSPATASVTVKSVTDITSCAADHTMNRLSNIKHAGL